jgi:hypothetical protein
MYKYVLCLLQCAVAANRHMLSLGYQDPRIRECMKRDALFRDHAKLDAHGYNVIIHALSLIRVTPHLSCR